MCINYENGIIVTSANIIENIKFSHGFDKAWRHDHTCSIFFVNVAESISLSGNGMLKKNISWFHISNYIQAGKKTILHF